VGATAPGYEPAGAAEGSFHVYYGLTGDPTFPADPPALVYVDYFSITSDVEAVPHLHIPIFPTPIFK
jgi:hypothetical protein